MRPWGVGLALTLLGTGFLIGRHSVSPIHAEIAVLSVTVGNTGRWM